MQQTGLLPVGRALLGFFDCVFSSGSAGVAGATGSAFRPVHLCLRKTFNSWPYAAIWGSAGPQICVGTGWVQTALGRRMVSPLEVPEISTPRRISDLTMPG